MIKRIIFSLGLLAFFIASPVQALSPSVSRFETSPDGKFVTQTIELQAPAKFVMNFSPCNVNGAAAGCSGPDDPLRDCHVGHYSYNFGGDLPIWLTVPPLSGSTAKKVFAKTGSVFGVPSHYGYFDPASTTTKVDSGFDTGTGLGAIFSNQPVVEQDGALSFSFREALPRELMFTIRGLKPSCYLPPEIAEKYRGQTFDNSYATRYKIAIVWQLDNPGHVVNTNQTIEINGQQQTIPASYGTNGPSVNMAPDSAIIDTLGHSIPSNPTSGLTGQDLVSALATKGYTFDHQTDMGTISSRLANGEPAIVWVTSNQASQPQSGAVLVTGYNSQRDTFQVTDATNGRTSNVSYNQFMNQNPNFNFITKVSK